MKKRGTHKRRPGAPCHPDKMHYAKGLCKNCYYSQLRRRPRRIRLPTPVTCHPGRKHAARGLCMPCYHLNINLTNRHGIAYDEAVKLNGVASCQICERPLASGSNSLPNQRVIDHNHATKKIRAVLCKKCNAILGMAREDQFIMHAAIKYLQSHSDSYRRQRTIS